MSSISYHVSFECKFANLDNRRSNTKSNKEQRLASCQVFNLRTIHHLSTRANGTRFWPQQETESCEIEIHEVAPSISDAYEQFNRIGRRFCI